MAGSDLSTKGLLDRLDGVAERSSRERREQAETFAVALAKVQEGHSAEMAAFRAENKAMSQSATRGIYVLMLLLVAGVLALAGVQVRLSPSGAIETIPAPEAEALVEGVSDPIPRPDVAEEPETLPEEGPPVETPAAGADLEGDGPPPETFPAGATDEEFDEPDGVKR